MGLREIKSQQFDMIPGLGSNLDLCFRAWHKDSASALLALIPKIFAFAVGLDWKQGLQGRKPPALQLPKT